MVLILLGYAENIGVTSFQIGFTRCLRVISLVRSDSFLLATRRMRYSPGNTGIPASGIYVVWSSYSPMRVSVVGKLVFSN